jgi:hypothetical protein
VKHKLLKHLSNPDCPVDDLSAHKKDPIIDVRVAVANHPKTPSETITFMLSDRAHDVLRAIAFRHDLQLHQMQALMTKSYKVWQSLVANQICPESILRRGFEKSFDVPDGQWIWVRIGKNFNCPDDLLDAILAKRCYAVNRHLIIQFSDRISGFRMVVPGHEPPDHLYIERAKRVMSDDFLERNFENIGIEIMSRFAYMSSDFVLKYLHKLNNPWIESNIHNKAAVQEVLQQYGKLVI